MGKEFDVRDGTHDSPKYFDYGHPLVTSKNLKDYGLDLSDVSLISSKDFEAVNKRSKVDIGDILFGMIGTIGHPVRVDRDDFAIKNVALIKEKSNVLNSFLIQVLKSPSFERYIKNENAGGTQKFLALSKVRNFTFLCPSLEEQNCVSSFFKQLDDLITLHQRKLEALQLMKKGFLQQMFPLDGESVPRIRFTDFDGDWEQRKLTDIVTRINKSSNSDKLPKVEFEDISAGRGCLNKDISSKFDNRKGIEFKPEDILYGKLRPYLKNWLMPNFKGVALGDFWVFRARESNPFFIYFLIQADKYQKVANDTAGTKMPRSDWKNVSNTIFLIPEKGAEQTQIGSFFKQLDNLINLHQNKLEYLKKLKKAFLQNMFI